MTNSKENYKRPNSELILERELSNLCSNSNPNKLKETILKLLGLSCKLQKETILYLNTSPKFQFKELNREILNSFEIQHSFLKVTFYELFNQIYNEECRFEKTHISKEDLINDYFVYSDLLSRLLIIIDNKKYELYIIEMLFSINKIISLILSI